MKNFKLKFLIALFCSTGIQVAYAAEGITTETAPDPFTAHKAYSPREKKFEQFYLDAAKKMGISTVYIQFQDLSKTEPHKLAETKFRTITINTAEIGNSITTNDKFTVYHELTHVLQNTTSRFFTTNKFLLGTTAAGTAAQIFYDTYTQKPNIPYIQLTSICLGAYLFLKKDRPYKERNADLNACKWVNCGKCLHLTANISLDAAHNPLGYLTKHELLTLAATTYKDTYCSEHQPQENS